jgi:hypothetical protein
MTRGRRKNTESRNKMQDMVKRRNDNYSVTNESVDAASNTPGKYLLSNFIVYGRM